jgi:pyruvoyl-dependent arginine decarboxylase (PvlArgDC)
MARHPHTSALLAAAAGPHDRRCSGARDLDEPHLLALVVAIGVATPRFAGLGARSLDEIVAFDLAEVDTAMLGGINMTTVSSFLGPKGLLLGYDVGVAPGPRLVPLGAGEPLPVSGDGAPLLAASLGLLGTLDDPLMPFHPGSLVPCAHRAHYQHGSAELFAGVGVGIPRDRGAHPCVLMEDAGEVQPGTSEADLRRALEESVRVIAEIQRIPLAQVLVCLRLRRVPAGEIGCALVACPYLRPAREALPRRAA